MREVYDAIHALLHEGRSGALATVVRTSGSTPQVPGAKLLLRADGSQVGTVGGGRFEQVVLEALASIVQGGPAQVARWHLTRDLGMCCGGQMEVFLERIEAAPHLILFGAGHVSHATARVALVAGFRVTVIDVREEWNTQARFPEAERVYAEPAEAIRGDAMRWGASTYAVIATHDHGLDEEALMACLPKGPVYVGMIGSRRKVLRIFERIRVRRPELDLASVHAPIGVDIGAVTAEEIGVAIVAELVAVRRGMAGAVSRSGVARAGVSLPDDEGEAPRLRALQGGEQA